MGLAALTSIFYMKTWGTTNFSPCCVADHKITGIITKVGKNVTHLKVRDCTGSGVVSFSCLKMLRLFL